MDDTARAVPAAAGARARALVAVGDAAVLLLAGHAGPRLD